jgi:hypothetical protein
MPHQHYHEEGLGMRTLRFRITGPEQAFDAMMATLTGLDHVNRVEEIGDLMSGMRDDSSSADLVDDDRGDSHDIEVHATSDHGADAVRNVVETRAMELGIAVEFAAEF